MPTKYMYMYILTFPVLSTENTLQSIDYKLLPKQMFPLLLLALNSMISSKCLNARRGGGSSRRNIMHINTRCACTCITTKSVFQRPSSQPSPFYNPAHFIYIHTHTQSLYTLTGTDVGKFILGSIDRLLSCFTCSSWGVSGQHLRRKRGREG